MTAVKEVAHALVRSLWQIRNNLFHGEKGYGANFRVESDQMLLEDACKIISAIISVLLPDAARGFAG